MDEEEQKQIYPYSHTLGQGKPEWQFGQVGTRGSGVVETINEAVLDNTWRKLPKNIRDAIKLGAEIGWESGSTMPDGSPNPIQTQDLEPLLNLSPKVLGYKAVRAGISRGLGFDPRLVDQAAITTGGANLLKKGIKKVSPKLGLTPNVLKTKPTSNVIDMSNKLDDWLSNPKYSKFKQIPAETSISVVKPGSLFSKNYKGILSKPQPYAYAATEAPKNEFEQLVFDIEKKDSAIKIKGLPSNMPTPFISAELNEELGPDGNRLEGLTYQEIQSIGRAAKTYERKREYKDAATEQGYLRMTVEVEQTFIDLLGDDFDRDLVRQYMLDVSKHETALKELQRITNDKTGKLWDVSHALALRNLEHSGRMLGNKGLFPAFNYEDTLDQTPLGKPIVKIIREGNRPDPKARGADFQRTLSRVLGKPLSLHESVLYWYDQNMFYFYKELSPLQRQQLVDSSRTRSGGRIKSELTLAENLNQALESMKFGKETMSGKLGRPLTAEERMKALVDVAQAELLKKRKYKRTNFKNLPRQGNVFYDIDTGEVTDYSPDPGTGSSWDIEDPDPDNKYN